MIWRMTFPANPIVISVSLPLCTAFMFEMLLTGLSLMFRFLSAIALRTSKFFAGAILLHLLLYQLAGVKTRRRILLRLRHFLYLCRLRHRRLLLMTLLLRYHADLLH